MAAKEMRIPPSFEISQVQGTHHVSKVKEYLSGFVHTSIETQEETDQKQSQDWLDCYDSLNKIKFYKIEDWSKLGAESTIEEDLRRLNVPPVKRYEVLSLLSHMRDVPHEGDPVDPQKRLHIGKFSMRIGGRPNPPSSVIDHYLRRKPVGQTEFPWGLEGFLDKIFMIENHNVSSQTESHQDVEHTSKVKDLDMESGVEYPVLTDNNSNT